MTIKPYRILYSVFGSMSVDKTQHPIYQAVKDGDLQVDIRDKVNSTSLSWASSCGHLEMVKYLAEHGHLGIVKFLVEHDINTLVLNGGRTLTAACERAT